MSLPLATTTQLWKLADTAADKSGPHHSVYWVRKNPAFEESRRLGLSAEAEEYKSGSKYSGDWQSNKRHGFGTQTWSNGDKYEGDWRRNKMHGKGTFWVKRKGKLRKQYTGDWVANMRHVRGPWGVGRAKGLAVAGVRGARGVALRAGAGGCQQVASQGVGVFFYDSGGKYEGEWFENLRHGRGKMNFPNGDEYEGEWEVDKRSGFGVMVYGAPPRLRELPGRPRAHTARSEWRPLRGLLARRQEGRERALLLLCHEQDVPWAVVGGRAPLRRVHGHAGRLQRSQAGWHDGASARCVPAAEGALRWGWRGGVRRSPASHLP